MQIHPSGSPILVALHSRDSLATIDPERPDSAIVPVSSVGPKPSLREFASLEYSTGIRSFVYYSAADGAVVYGIDLNGKASWRVLAAQSGVDPVLDAASQSRYHVNRTHTFGRFRIAHFDDVDLAILVRHVDSPVYAMRLPE
jgi:hypothetical protein